MKKPTSGVNDEDKSTLSTSSKLAQIKHIDWDAKINFDSHTIHAKASYNIQITAKDDVLNEFCLDTRGLIIHSITLQDTPVKNWTLEDPVENSPHLGQRLAIPLREISFSSSNKTIIKVSIEYTTSSDPSQCTAAQWLTPAQTLGKVHPFLFTQSQAIHARSILPSQDCPAVKFTYTGKVTVPAWATAVMSCPIPSTTNHITTTTDTSLHTFAFTQKTPIPAYLFALAIGQLSHKDLSSRTRIWSEPSLLSKSSSEFHHYPELFLQRAEQITGQPYDTIWGSRYDMLVLPPSFPYGGTEHPNMTFLTPTLLTSDGDGSLVHVIAHEIAHSWTGNLVTNRTWNHFWLNEGWTVWLERKIMNHSLCFNKDGSTTMEEDEKKREVAMERLHLDAMEGWNDLETDIPLFPPSASRLVLDLGTNDPDDSYSSVPYEKGFFLLFTLENIVGEEVFLGLLRDYIQAFQYGTTTSEEFRDFAMTYFRRVLTDGTFTTGSEVEVLELLEEGFDWDTWFYGEGMPPTKPDLNDSLARGAEELVQSWIEYDKSSSTTMAPTTSIEDWSVAQKICFLDKLNETTTFQIKTIKRMKEQYKFHESGNSELLFRFCKLSIVCGDRKIFPTVVRFITSQGRMKYVRPLYRKLFEDGGEEGKDLAVKTFLGKKNFYHPIAAKMLAIDLGANGSNSGTDESKKGKEENLSWTTSLGILAVLSIGAMILNKKR